MSDLPVYVVWGTDPVDPDLRRPLMVELMAKVADEALLVGMGQVLSTEIPKVKPGTTLISVVVNRDEERGSHAEINITGPGVDVTWKFQVERRDAVLPPLRPETSEVS